ncbi:MAG TPA: hypothetical protein VGB05_04580 [Pyrinomonadaceae bacterium]|jgi:hypothetical protein
MLKRLFMTLALCVSCTLLLAACGTASNSNYAPATNAPATNTGKAATNTAAPAATAPASTAAAGDRIGVPECDDYIAKYEACVSGKVPAAARAQYESSLAQMRSSWRDLAANPQTRAGLAQACKTATETARQSMKPMGCEF